MTKSDVSTNKIMMITDDKGKCKKCQAVEEKIKKIFAEHKQEYELTKLHYETEDAVKLAVRYGLDNVPSFVMNSRIFNADDFNEADLVKAMKRQKK